MPERFDAVINHTYKLRLEGLRNSYFTSLFAAPYLGLLTSGGGDRGAGDREKRGREVYGRREKRGRDAGFPRWREAGEKGKNYATLRNISQSKKCKGAGAKKYRAGTGIKGYWKREVQTPLCPPPLTD